MATCCLWTNGLIQYDTWFQTTSICFQKYLLLKIYRFRQLWRFKTGIRFRRGIPKILWANGSPAKHRAFLDEKTWWGPHSSEGTTSVLEESRENDLPSVFIILDNPFIENRSWQKLIQSLNRLPRYFQLSTRNCIQVHEIVWLRNFMDAAIKLSM